MSPTMKVQKSFKVIFCMHALETLAKKVSRHGTHTKSSCSIFLAAFKNVLLDSVQEQHIEVINECKPTC